MSYCVPPDSEELANVYMCNPTEDIVRDEVKNLKANTRNDENS